MTKKMLLTFLVLFDCCLLISQSKKSMHQVDFNQQGDLKIISSNSSSQNDFDFLVGKWNIHNRKLKSRLSNSKEWIEFDASQEMRKVLTGMGNVENITAMVNDQAYEGMAVRLFNPATKLWSIHWADNISGSMDRPVVGSFENNIGTFYGKDMFKGTEVILQFKWDITNPEKPVWSQAFSDDLGKTWEWNWYMYFTKSGVDTVENPTTKQDINVIELRNYFLKPGRREEFINYFEDNFIQSQNILGASILGQYRVKAADDNFFWIRGFKDMPARNKFLNDFYFGDFWKAHKAVPNSLLLNNDNVYLLKPLNLKDNSTNPAPGFNSNWFGKDKGITVVDFFTSNTKLDKLVDFVRKQYTAILATVGIDNTSFWVSETSKNEFTQLPVFQDKNLLVQITFYKNEFEYQSKIKLVESSLSEQQKIDLADLVTLKNTIILYPTERSFKSK